MLEKNKFILIGAAVVLVVWGVLYSMLVSPTWTARDTVKAEAQGQLDRWNTYYKKKKGSVKLVSAKETLENEDGVLRSSLDQLRQIECSADLGPFIISSAGSGDANNYFDKKRRDVLRSVKGLTLAPGLGEHFGFQGKLKSDPVSLKLTRLFMLNRFFQSAKRAGVKQIIKIDYPKVVEKELMTKVAKDNDEDEEIDPKRIDRIFEIPMVIRVQAKEDDLAQLLCELQLPSDQTRSYFCLRGISIEVRTDVQGMVDAQIALGGIFPEEQYVNVLKIPVEEKKHGSTYAPGPSIGTRDY